MGTGDFNFLLGSESSGSGTSRSHCSGARRGSCSSSIESYWVAACFFILVAGVVLCGLVALHVLRVLGGGGAGGGYVAILVIRTASRARGVLRC